MGREEGETDGYFLCAFAFLIWEGTGSLPKQPLLLISTALARGAGGRRGSSQPGKPGLLLLPPIGWDGVRPCHCGGTSPPAAPLSPAGDGGSSPCCLPPWLTASLTDSQLNVFTFAMWSTSQSMLTVQGKLHLLFSSLACD